MIKNTVRENSIGLMEGNILVIGKMVNNMELVNIQELMEKQNLVNGKMEEEPNGKNERDIRTDIYKSLNF